MAKQKYTWSKTSYGIYKNWDKTTRNLPELVKFTETIPASLDVEFGYILNLKKAKGKKIHYCIEHPPFTDEQGEIMPPFTGELYVRSNDWNFFLGDALWEPLDNKTGPWRLITTIDDVVLADQTFMIQEGMTI